jgi:hypothetical protein
MLIRLKEFIIKDEAPDSMHELASTVS